MSSADYWKVLIYLFSRLQDKKGRLLSNSFFLKTVGTFPNPRLLEINYDRWNGGWWLAKRLIQYLRLKSRISISLVWAQDFFHILQTVERKTNVPCESYSETLPRWGNGNQRHSPHHSRAPLWCDRFCGRKHMCKCGWLFPVGEFLLHMSILKCRYLKLTHRQKIRTDPGTVCGSALSSHSLEDQSEPASDTESLHKAECSSETHTYTVNWFTLKIYFAGMFSLTILHHWIIDKSCESHFSSHCR